MHLLPPTIWLVLTLPLSAATLLNPVLGDGDFELGVGNWVEIGSKNSFVLTPTTGVGTAMHYSADKRGFIGFDTGMLISTGATASWAYNWTGDAAFKTAGSSVNLVFYHTSNNLVNGTIAGFVNANSGLVATANTYEAESGGFTFTDPAANGRNLFLGIRASTYDGSKSADNAFFHIDNLSVTYIPEPGPFYTGLLTVLLAVLRRRRH